MINITDKTIQFFKEHFQEKPQRIFLSPGRINIIGEHVDYNDGFVLPAAIDKYVCLAVSESTDSKCSIIAKDLDERYEFDVTEDITPVKQMWANYFLGILLLMKKRGLLLKGFRAVFTSTIPIGAGLSSSAAVECGFAFALNELFDLGLDKKEIALMGQESENNFVGVQCGIMDQFASVFGKRHRVIKLDCNSLEYEYHQADFKNYALLLLNSKVKHSHLTSGYNTRREETAAGIAIVKKAYPAVKNFRDCTEEHLSALREELGETIFKRCAFVVKEIHRVLDAVNALEASDFQRLGRLMFETHDGLSQEYEVSCPETDFLVDAVRHNPKVLGARMMGGGFGGCTINLVEKDYEDELIENVSTAYRNKFNIAPEAYKIELSAGTHEYKNALPHIL